MNNEEKILALLVELKESMDKRFDAVDTRLDGMDKRMDAMDERLDELDARSLRTAVLLETEVARDIRLVYEGQEMLRQKLEELAPTERVEALEDDMTAVKSTVKIVVTRLDALEKAQ